MKRNTRPPESICWDCKNARAHLCAWIGRGEKIWDGGKKEKRSANTKKTKSRIYVHIVTECRYFEPDAKRTRKVVAW